MNRSAHLLIIVLFNLLAGIPVSAQSPEWAKEAVWYQIFPERFRNGDPANDPTRDSLEWPVAPSAKWGIRRWTSDWYSRDAWETAMNSGRDYLRNFYSHGVRDRRYGGDLQGVLDKLDYLAGLGVNTIYFCPLFYACSSHKYDGNSYHHIDPYFGPDPKGDLALIEQETGDPVTWHWTAADKLFLEIIKAAHQRGLKIVIDGVFNHTGRDFFAFKDLRVNQETSAYKDWYVVYSYTGKGKAPGDFSYEGWWGIKALPIFASSVDGLDMHPLPKAYIFAATKRWMVPNGNPADGIDGWRLDAANERPVKFWADWNAWVRELNPKAYTVCEIWSASGWLIKGGQFSAAMNYQAFAFPVKEFLIDNHLSASGFAKQLDERRDALPGWSVDVMQNLIDSHDTDRLATMVVNGQRKGKDSGFNTNNDVFSSPSYQIRKPDERERLIQRLVVLFQMTYIGAPMIYYGDEAGMWGAHDPDNRMPMVWQDLKYDPQTIDPRGKPRKPDDVNFDPAVFDFYKKAIELRRDHPALMHGDYRVVGTFDKEQVFAFLRSDPSGSLLVVINRNGKSQSGLRIELPEGCGIGHSSLIFSTGDPKAIKIQTEGDRMFLMDIPALTGVVIGSQP
jgi:glycosidase